MSATAEKKQHSKSSILMSMGGEELEVLIEKALDKIGGKKENDICRYLPVDAGGYMHHFTLKKMKHEVPSELARMISKFIIETDKPSTVPPRPRAARGSRKNSQVMLSRKDLDRMLNIARMVGDKDIVAKLTPRKSLAAIKRELIACVKQGRVDQELWNAYCECIHVQQGSSSESSTSAPQSI